MMRSKIEFNPYFGFLQIHPKFCILLGELYLDKYSKIEKNVYWLLEACLVT